MDIAGPLFKGDKWTTVSGFYEGGVTPNIAKKTIAFYTNPGYLGTNRTDKAQVNIKVNPDSYIQPGSNGNIYNHVFPLMLVGSLCARTKCLDSGNNMNLNFFENPTIPAGTYTLVFNKCYPFCREEENIKP